MKAEASVFELNNEVGMKLLVNNIGRMMGSIVAVIIGCTLHSFSQEVKPSPEVKPETAVKAAPEKQAAVAPTKATPEAKAVEAQKPESDSATLTTGIWTGENYFEGRLDALLPLLNWSAVDGKLFFDGRGAWADEGEEEFNAGLVYRQRCLPAGGILGVNTFYDSRWTKDGAQFNQWGLGAEALTKWVDFRANYYLPENKTEKVGSEEVVTLEKSTYKTEYDQYAVNSDLHEKWVRSLEEFWNKDVYDIYSVPLKGYDAEIGVKLPLNIKNFESRLFIGYYDFEQRGGHFDTPDVDISGLKSRFEVRGWNRLIVDAEVYEDEDLFDSKFMLSARYRVPIGKDGPHFDEGITDRMGEMVMRDPHVQLRSGIDVSRSLVHTSKPAGSGDSVVLSDAIFVNADNVGDTAENGSGQHPFDSIQEGVDQAQALSRQNVYVFGAHNEYQEDVLIMSGVSLYGEGYQFGHTYPGLGVAPVVTGSLTPAGVGMFSIMSLAPVVVAGFDFNGADQKLIMPIKTGIYADSAADLTVAGNNFRNLVAGIYSSQASVNPTTTEIAWNTFDNVGAGIIGSSDSESTLIIHDNVIQNSLAGVVAFGLSNDTDFDVSIYQNTISGNSSDVGQYVNPDLIIGLMGNNAFTDFGMDIPTEFPIPSILGIGVAAIDGARVHASIRDNEVSGSLFGLLGISYSGNFMDPSVLTTTVVDNHFVGGGFSPIYTLAYNHAGSLANLFFDYVLGSDLPDNEVAQIGAQIRQMIPETLGTDFGISGITLVSADIGGELAGVFYGNTIEDYILGFGFGAAMGGSIDKLIIAENTFNDDFIGILGLALADSQIKNLGIFQNTINVGGTDKINEMNWNDNRFTVPNGGLLGIGLATLGDNASIDDLLVQDNTISRALIGFAAYVDAESEITGSEVSGNLFRENLVGILGVANGTGAEFKNFVIANNTIIGGGASELAEVLDIVDSIIHLSLPNISISDDLDFGLLGIGMVGLDGADMNGLWIHDNTVTRNVLGVGLVGVEGVNIDDFVIEHNLISDSILGIGLLASSDGGLTTMDDGLVANNIIADGWAGIIGYADGASFDRLDIYNNTITADTDDIIGKVLVSSINELSAQYFPTDEVRTEMPGLWGIALFADNGGSFNDAIVRNNSVDGFMWGIAANAEGSQSSLNGLTIRSNYLTLNTIGIQVVGLNGADLGNVEVNNNTISGSAFGIIAAASDDDSGSTDTAMSIQIANNLIVGNGNDFGLAFYGLIAQNSLLDKSEALDPFKMLDLYKAPSIAEFESVFPDELFETDPTDTKIENLFGPNRSTQNGFSGILVSFNGMKDDSATIEDNTILGFKNGTYVAIMNSGNIGLIADNNNSNHNIILGDDTQYTLSGSNAGSFSHLW